MHEFILVKDMAIVMVISAVITILCHRLRLPVVLGYILAGVLIGPHTPPYPLITDLNSIQTLSTLGIIFLLFSIGLEFSFKKLLTIGPIAFLAAPLEILLMIGIGFSLGRAFGWSLMNSLFLSAIISISSTTIIAKVLIETKKMEQKFAHIILGILIVEDLLAIIIIAVLSGIATTGTLTIEEIVFSMLKVAGFIAAMVGAGIVFIPRLLRYVEHFQAAEMMVILPLGLCLGSAFLAAQIGFSVALGAFLMGAIIAGTKQARQIIRSMAPIRDMFTAIFFVSVGMLLDPAATIHFAVPIAIIALVVILGKIFSCSFAAFLTGYPAGSALMVGLGLAQIGEFSFIIAQLGRNTRVTDSFLYPVAVSVSVITAIATPFLMNNAPGIVRLVKHITPQPIVTFAGLYTAWLEKIGVATLNSRRRFVIWNSFKRYWFRLCFYLVCIVGICFSGLKFGEELQVHIPYSIYWTLIDILIFPFLIGFAYTVDKVVWEVVFLNLVKSRAEINKARETGQGIHNMFRFVVVLGTGLTFLLIVSFFMSTFQFLVLIVLWVIIAGFLLWGSIRRIHERIEGAILSVFDEKKEALGEESQLAHAQLLELIQKDYPLEVETQDVLLPYEESAVNQTIRQLGLRARTGASLVGIYRDSESLPNPSAETKLLPGDVLLLMGDKEQITAAVLYLHQKMKEPPPVTSFRQPQTRRVKISAKSLCVGKTIRELNLREKTGINILALERNQVPMINPDPSSRIEKGDVLVLFGGSHQLQEAIRSLDPV